MENFIDFYLQKNIDVLTPIAKKTNKFSLDFGTIEEDIKELSKDLVAKDEQKERFIINGEIRAISLGIGATLLENKWKIKKQTINNVYMFLNNMSEPIIPENKNTSSMKIYNFLANSKKKKNMETYNFYLKLFGENILLPEKKCEIFFEFALKDLEKYNPKRSD